MTRKSVGFLTEVRQEVKDTLHEMQESALDFSNLATDLDRVSVDKIRTDDDEAYKEMMKAQRYLSTCIRKHRAAVKNLKEFFPF